ncbi:ribose 1,5-bisphosphokinase [Martelella alba]|uniref:Ribose 1,5-bisphosphate phosphokinase PhnN n=1 Tax=Martelella alba TaxID=2590451 RepID=A0ABY2SQS4_9HYPH|nr:ribose 1,5-bisphosphokinase [Martelella alba]TKI07755.1 ribose 1,5-bisphosphokinase [Martelella alba]
MTRLIYLMGPSGSGKDSLLASLRANPVPTLLVSHRYITRPAGDGSENHIALSKDEFLQRRAAGLFALHWQAHQHYYGLGIEIDLWLLRDRHVIVNGSREYLGQALQRYGDRLLPVCLRVSPASLRQRLTQRGRETDREIVERLARAERYQRDMPAQVVWLDNNGRLADTLAAFQALLPTADAVTHHHRSR